jgi:hypothetical protein
MHYVGYYTISQYRYSLETHFASIFIVEFLALKIRNSTFPTPPKPMALSAEFLVAAYRNTIILKLAVVLSHVSSLRLTQSRYFCKPYLLITVFFTDVIFVARF